jgi:hypothetical protein
MNRSLKRLDASDRSSHKLASDGSVPRPVNEADDAVRHRARLAAVRRAEFEDRLAL